MRMSSSVAISSLGGRAPRKVEFHTGERLPDHRVLGIIAEIVREENTRGTEVGGGWAAQTWRINSGDATASKLPERITLHGFSRLLIVTALGTIAAQNVLL
jgi:hypothetical protein